MRNLMMVVIALLALNVTAQDQKNRKDNFKYFSPEQVATLKTKKMTLHLDLTESQQSAVKSLALEEATRRKSQRNQRDEKKKNDTSEKPTKEERFVMANERLDKQIEMKKQMKSILNDEQYKKWETSLSNKNEKQREGRRDRKSYRK